MMAKGGYKMEILGRQKEEDKRKRKLKSTSKL
jgi:hypothetical protein